MALYAFDVGTGQVRWRYRGERGQGLTSPPTVAGERLFVGSRVYREINGARHRTYALLCLRVADGSEVWRFHTPTYVSAPIAVCDDRLFCSTDDGGLSALDINSGAEVWQVWRDAPVVTRPRVYGDQVIVATQPGEVVTIRRQAAPPPEPASPESYLQQGDPLQAAVAYALRGDFAAAAQIYADQDQPHAAAQLYERAHLPARAATLWAELGQLERARELYRSAGDQPGLAGVLERLGDKRQAAQLYAQARQWAEARRIWEELGAWEEVVALLIAQEEWREAARLLEQHGRLESAAERYEQAGALPAALRLRVTLEQWECVVELAGRVGAYEMVAVALERLGQPGAAAAAYVQAAQQALAAPPADEAQLAGLYEQAAQLYLEAFDPDQAAECRRAVRRYRQLPEVIVVGKPAGTFVEYQWNALRLQMENSGYGPAYDIRISFESDCFDAEQIPTTPCLFPQTTETREVSIRPGREQYGPRVPLNISLTYADAEGRLYTDTRRMPIHVVQQGRADQAGTPETIEVGHNSLPPEQLRQPRWNTAVLRNLLIYAFNDEEIRALCFDYFPAVFHNLTTGMSMQQIVTMLLENCYRTDSLVRLVELVRERNPVQYERVAGQLLMRHKA